MYHPSDREVEQYRKAIASVFACAFVDDIEDYIWEAIFATVRGIQLIDPLFNVRKKELFDLVDPKTRTGWSAKALQWNFSPGCYFELVIQRADIFEKAFLLGYEDLSVDTPEHILGEALIKHWRAKFNVDSKAQGIEKPRVCILLKNKARTEYALYEADFHIYAAESLTWEWTDHKKRGLQGRLNGSVVYRWYRSQKQLFERFCLPPDAKVIKLTPRRLPMNSVLELLYERLHSKP